MEMDYVVLSHYQPQWYFHEHTSCTRQKEAGIEEFEQPQLVFSSHLHTVPRRVSNILQEEL